MVCPTSLVKNWAAEITKWLGDRLEGGVLALSETSRECVIQALCKFTRTGPYVREPKFPPVSSTIQPVRSLHRIRSGPGSGQVPVPLGPIPPQGLRCGSYEAPTGRDPSMCLWRPSFGERSTGEARFWVRRNGCL